MRISNRLVPTYKGSWKFYDIGPMAYTYEVRMSAYCCRFGAVCSFVAKSNMASRYNLESRLMFDDNYNPIWDNSNSSVIVGSTIIQESIDFTHTNGDGDEWDIMNQPLFGLNTTVPKKGGDDRIYYPRINPPSSFPTGYQGNAMYYMFGTYCMPGNNIYPEIVKQESYTNSLWENITWQGNTTGDNHTIFTRFGDLVIIRGNASLKDDTRIFARNMGVINIPEGYRMSFPRGLDPETGFVGVLYGTDILNAPVVKLDATSGAVGLYYSTRYHALIMQPEVYYDGEIDFGNYFGNVEKDIRTYDYIEGDLFKGKVRVNLFATWNINDNGKPNS